MNKGWSAQEAAPAVVVLVLMPRITSLARRGKGLYATRRKFIFLKKHFTLASARGGKDATVQQS